MAISVTGLTVHTQNGGGTWTDYGSGGGSSSTTATFLAGTTSRGRKFTGAKGFAFEVNAAGTDLSNTIMVVRFLVNGGLGATLAGGGASIRMEDTSGNISDWYVAGSDTYTGGFFEAVIDTANAESANSGTPATLSAIRYVGLYCNAAASSGGDPNVYVDEILSMPNTGLTLGGNTTQLFDELADWDDTSLYGIIQRRGGNVFSKCPLILAPDATGHESVDEILIFEEPIYEDGTNVDSALTLQGLSSSDADPITLTRLICIAADNADIGGTNADKELDFTSASDITADTCTFRGFNGTTVHLGGSGNIYDDCVFQGLSQIVDTGAVVRRGFVRDTAAAATEAALLWTTSSDWQDTVFIMGATNSHAIEIETAITDDWTGFTFNGYNTSGAGTSVGDEVLNSNNATGSTTINASDITGTISFYQRGAGSDPTINNNVLITLTNLVNDTEITVYRTSDDLELATVEDVVGNQFQFSVSASLNIYIYIHHVAYYRADILNYTTPSVATSLPISQVSDPNYVNN